MHGPQTTASTLVPAQARELLQRVQGLDATHHAGRRDTRTTSRPIHEKPWGARARDREDAPKTKAKVKVPKVGVKRRDSGAAAEDRLLFGNQRDEVRPGEGKRQLQRPMRKSLAQIEAERRELQDHQALHVAQAPLKRSGFNNLDAEKRKLQLQFQFKGGKALPDAGLPGQMQGHLPTNLLQNRAPRKSLRTLTAESKAAHNAQKARTQRLECDFDEVAGLVKAKQALLDSIPPTNLQSIAKVRAQLHTLMDQLRTIDELLEEERQGREATGK